MSGNGGSGYNPKSEYAFSYSIKQNAKGEFLIEKISIRSDEGSGLYLIPAETARLVLKALHEKGFKTVGYDLIDNKN